jgi:hypothetical protein
MKAHEIPSYRIWLIVQTVTCWNVFRSNNLVSPSWLRNQRVYR